MKQDDLTFVNVLGEPISRESLETKRQKRNSSKTQPDSYHNGWRVQGIPPGTLEEAKQNHAAEAAILTSAGKESKAWSYDFWLLNAKRKAVRSKPYEVPQAAQECKKLAEKAGWLRVEIVELKKEKSAEAA